MKRITDVVFALVILGGVWSSGANAQGTDSCTAYTALVKNNPSSCLFRWSWNQLPDPNAPATMVCCNLFGTPFGEACVAPRPSCSAPSRSALDICTSCLTAGHPINLSSGNTFITESDINVPGLGGGLVLTRTWNSMLPDTQGFYAFMFGVKWRSNFEERLVFNSGDGFLRYLRGDGSVWSFAVVSVGNPNIYQVAAPANDTTTTITAGSPSWTLTAKNGEKRLFDATTGMLVSIIDRNGNTAQLTYDSSHRLSSVADAAGRHLNFTYASPSSSLVTSVTSDVGLSLAYAYDSQGRLTQVTKPDNTTISFMYDANNLITAVKDSAGKILESHTYDAAGRGLTSSRANGVDAVTVTYPQ